MSGAIIFLGLFFFLLPVLILALIILIVTRKSEATFQVKVDAIYSYAILVGTIILAIIGIIGIIMTLTNIIIPDEYNNINEELISLITFIGTLAISIPIFIGHKKRIETKKNNINE